MLQTILQGFLCFIPTTINDSIPSGYLPTAFNTAGIIQVSFRYHEGTHRESPRYQQLMTSTASLISSRNPLMHHLQSSCLSVSLEQPPTSQPVCLQSSIFHRNFPLWPSVRSSTMLEQPNCHQSSSSLTSQQCLLHCQPQDCIVQYRLCCSGGNYHTMAIWRTLNLSSPFLLQTFMFQTISSCMSAHHLKLNPSKIELLFIPEDTFPCWGLVISLDNSQISPSVTAFNLGVSMDKSFSSHIAKLIYSCRFLI